MLREVAPLLQSGSCPAVAQLEAHATYCAKRTPADGYIDWTSSSKIIDRLIRATTKPYPGAFTFAEHEKMVVWQAEFHDGSRYSALPGQILYFERDMPVVRCGDGVNLILLHFEVGTAGRHGGSRTLAVHQRLGFPPPWASP
jgi:methionyl-tRNA formyltransferase